MSEGQPAADNTGGLQVENLTVSYGSTTAVSNATIQVPSGKITALIGPNGAGKSTLLRAAMGLIPRDSGTATVGGKPLDLMRRHIAYVPQRGEVDWDFPITVGQTALLGTYPNLGLFRLPNRAARHRAQTALAQVELSDLSDRPVNQLSGGQQQRMFLARAIAQNARLFLLDEPFSSVDAKSEQVIVAVLNQMRSRGAAILIVHHDLGTLEKYFDQAIVLNTTVRAAGTPSEVLNSPELPRAYNLSALTAAREPGRGE